MAPLERDELSIVIPCFNEAKRLKPNLSSFQTHIQKKLPERAEIVFVNDGSTDQTLNILEEFKKNLLQPSVKIVSYQPNRGKGCAVKQGILQAGGDKVIVMDADFSIHLDEIERCLALLDSYDIVVGTKKHLLTQTMVKQRIPRRILGKGFTMMTNFFLGLRFTDITCGFKGFRTPVAKNLFKRAAVERWSYDSEILFLAKLFNYKTFELPVRWYHMEGSKVSPVVDTFGSFRDLIKIKLNYYLGKYH